jgi:DNA-binding NtrC family response regulator
MVERSRQLLIVDDSPAIVEMVVEHFETLGFRMQKATRGSEAIQHIKDGFDGVVLLDFKLPDVSGLDLLDQIRALVPTTPVIIITAHGSINLALEAVQNRGAFFVHSKTEESFLDRLTGTIYSAFSQLDMVRKLRSLENQVESRYSFEAIISQSRRMEVLFRTLQNVVDSKVTVLIQGESGTGKELVAKALHYNGPRREQPFVPINCAGIPDTLLESELFGYEKGAFTGAYARKSGKFEQAHKGTLFLDEIGEMNLALQAKILRVLQEREFERLGGRDTIRVDVRIVSATNRDLEVAVRNGLFREDLFYRLSVFPVDLPPLRERREDIPLLTEHFLKQYAREEGRDIAGVTPRALDRLSGFNYPGNVRQLENIISHAVVVCSGSKIDIGDLPPYLRGSDHPSLMARTEGGVHNLLDERSGLQIIPLHKLELIAIEKAIEACSGNVSLAARLLGVSRATIYRKLKGAGNLPEETP